MASPTSRTLQELKKRGYNAQVVEKWNSFAKVRIDLFGVIDIVACKGSEFGIWGIQATSTDNMSKRIDKALSTPALKTWLMCGGKFAVWGWALRGERGKRKTYELKERVITLRELEDAIP